MLNIFVDHISPRLIYTLQFVLGSRGVDYQLCNDYIQFETLNGVKLNYSDRYFQDIPQLKPSTLLFEETIEEYSITRSQFFQEDCFSFNGIIDPLASVFYTLSRMEEYITDQRDSLGRFPGKKSILYQNDWHEKAMCDRWSNDFLFFIKEKCGLNWHPKLERIACIPTFDIDNAFAYQHKNQLRTKLATAKDMIYARKERLLIVKKC